MYWGLSRILVRMPLADVWKALLGAGLGFFAGLLAEPLRVLMTNWAKLHKMRADLYHDVCTRYMDLATFVYKTTDQEVSGRHALRTMRRYIRDDLLEHFHKTDPSNLYRLPEFREIENFYTHLRSLRKAEFPTGKDYEAYCRDILNMCDYYVRSGRLSRRLAYRHGGWELIKHWRDNNAVYSNESYEELL